MTFEGESTSPTPQRNTGAFFFDRALGALAGRVIATITIVTIGVFARSPSAVADADTLPAPATESVDRFAIHGQLSYVEQETNSFSAPYAGPNSLSSSSGRETVDATLYVGSRLWSGAEAWINAEIDQGFGLDNTLGVAGFPSGSAYKVGKKKPYLRLQRAFIRETVERDGTPSAVEAAPNQFAGPVSENRWVATIGKFGVTDVFDTSQYAHDPRSDFMNWTAVDAGTLDYAADAWGYTVGAAIEWYAGAWTLRGGLFDLSTVPNSEHLEPAGHEFQIVAEVERRHELGGRPGRVLVTGFDTRGRMALLNDAVQLAAKTGGSVDVAAVRRYRSHTGVSATLEQQVSAELGLFARAGSAGGNVESYEFTDIDRTVSAGASLKGTRWNRSHDTIGAVAIVNGISSTRQAFLNAGGLGILVGDGRLPNPRTEQILETYYSIATFVGCYFSLDYQHVSNPGYNRDRGPVSIFAVRLHAQF